MGDAKLFNLSFSSQLFNSVNTRAKKESISRSELLRKAASQYLRSQENWDEIYRYGREQAKKHGITEGDLPKIIEGYRKNK